MPKEEHKYQGYNYFSTRDKAYFNKYICYNCSNLEAVSGHCCSLIAFYPFKPEDIIKGVLPCFFKKECGSNFLLFEGKEIKEMEKLYQEIKDRPLWIIHSNISKLTATELKQYEQANNLKKNRKKHDPYNEYLPADFAIKRIDSAKPLQSLDSDPLTKTNKGIINKNIPEEERKLRELGKRGK